MASTEVYIKLDTTSIEKVIEKASRLKELLLEVNSLIESLKGTNEVSLDELSSLLSAQLEEQTQASSC